VLSIGFETEHQVIARKGVRTGMQD
jgi:hypothetical protein